MYSILEVKLRRLRRRTYDDKYDIRDKNLPTVLANSSKTQPHLVSQYRMQVSNMFMVNLIFCPLKANTSRLKNTSLLVIEMSLNNAFNTGQIQRCQTRRSHREIIAEIMQTCDL